MFLYAFSIAILSRKEGIAIEKAYKNINIKCIQEHYYKFFSEGGKSGKAKALPALPLPTALPIQSLVVLLKNYLKWWAIQIYSKPLNRTPIELCILYVCITTDLWRIAYVRMYVS